jgi:predicted RNA binding protein YcfA (HicA-like mRNA interferase family)
VGRLSGYRYRDVTKRLKLFGFAFDRQAAGSHEIWYQHSGNRYTTIPNHPGDMPEGTLRAKRILAWMRFLLIELPFLHLSLCGGIQLLITNRSHIYVLIWFLPVVKN